MRRWLIHLFLFLIMGTPVANVLGQAKKVVTAEWLRGTYQGAFAVDMAQERGAPHRFGSSSGQHCQISPNQLLMRGHSHRNAVRQVTMAVPRVTMKSTELMVAKANGPWIVLEAPHEKAKMLYGFLPASKGKLYTIFGQYYAVTGKDHPTQSIHGLDGSLLEGPYRCSLRHNAVKGYAMSAPSSLRNSLYLAGNAGSPGTASNSWGPSLCTIEQPIVADRYTGTTLLDYPSTERLKDQLGVWNPTSLCKGGAWVETDAYHGVIFFGVTGTGRVWYGKGTVVIDGVEFKDPVSNSKGRHCDKWELRLWIYDPADLLKVRAGKMRPQDVQPTQAVNVTDWFFRRVTGHAPQVSYRDGRLIVVEPNAYQFGRHERTPICHVYALTKRRR